MLTGQCLEPLSQCLIVWFARAIPRHRPVDARYLAGGGGRYQFFPNASLSSELSRSVSANSVFSRLASDTSIPPYFDFQR